jgi:DNA-binding transcriptional MerR regulator
VRTLRHYDPIELLSPAARSSAGYRQYTDADIGRIPRAHFPLDTIATVLTGDQGHADQLREQRTSLGEQLLEVFGTWRPAPDVAERARRQWSDSGYWTEAEQRTTSRTPQECSRRTRKATRG